MKNPKPVAFVQQANISSGPQQVNNAPQPETSSVGSSAIQQSKLSEEKRNECLDAGMTQTAARELAASVVRASPGELAVSWMEFASSGVSAVMTETMVS